MPRSGSSLDIDKGFFEGIIVKWSPERYLGLREKK